MRISTFTFLLFIGFVVPSLEGVAQCTIQSGDSQSNVSTPKGSPVTAIITGENTNAMRAYFDGLYATAGRTYLYYFGGSYSSSRRFNCHGYAWHMIEGGAPRWIGYCPANTDEHIYWGDGSYVQVCNEMYPGKVSWGSGDHSAITTATPGRWISKWNEWPLVEHNWNDTPFSPHTNLKYYVSTNITGSTSLLCSGTRNFSARSISGASYTWSVSGTLSIVSGQGTSTVTIQRNGSSSGEGWIEVQISTPCSSGAATSKRERFHVGAPTVSAISVDASMCNGYGQNVTATISGNPTFRQWSVTSGNASNAYLTDYGSGTCYFNSYVNDCYGLQIQMTNACGSSLDGTTICVDNCLAGYKVYPNPAKDYISIEFEQFDRAGVMPDQLILYAENNQKAVYSIDNSQIFTGASKDGILKIDVNALPRGTYYLHVISGSDEDKKTDKIRIMLQ